MKQQIFIKKKSDVVSWEDLADKLGESRKPNTVKTYVTRVKRHNKYVFGTDKYFCWKEFCDEENFKKVVEYECSQNHEIAKIRNGLSAMISSLKVADHSKEAHTYLRGLVKKIKDGDFSPEKYDTGERDETIQKRCRKVKVRKTDEEPEEPEEPSKSYEIYKEKVGEKDMKQFDELPENIQQAWKAIDEHYRIVTDYGKWW